MAKSKHSCNLKLHQVKVTNLNYSPEKAGGGGELVPRVDLSLEISVDDEELAELVRVRTGSNVIKALWNKDGAPILLDAEPMSFDIEFTGKAELRFVNAADASERYTFDPARLRKLKIEPQTGGVAEVKCQLRVDPGDDLDALGDMRIAQQALFLFTGTGDDAGDNGKQQKLGDAPE